MLYKLVKTDVGFENLEPLPFMDFSSFGQREKELEALIAGNLLNVLYEDARLMPVFQERQYQAEADLYALNQAGDLILFELKRGEAGNEAVHQVLRYAQDAGQWRYAQLQAKYRQYSGNDVALNLAHREAFDLDHPLDSGEINKKQHLLVVGNALDEHLMAAVDYWKGQGVAIDFLPYRVYALGGAHYFEFFALPYDKHQNPADIKGVLFDTNRSWDEESIWYMMENSRVAAFGDAKRFIDYLHPGDIVFFSHKWVGVVAAARVKRGAVKAPAPDTRYREVEFITPVPERGSEVAGMPFHRVSDITGKSFFWARTIKVPYLSRQEAEMLAEELANYLAR
jgi:hypothetical protein